MKAKGKQSGRANARTRPAPLTIKRILVPVDFSGPSRKALACAAAFARQFDAKVTLLHVVEPVVTPDMEYLPFPIHPERISRLAEKKLQALARPHGKSARWVEQSLVRMGKPFREITETARELNMDLIIIATHGYTGIERALLGSTAERVVRYAPCPVLTVRDVERGFLGVGEAQEEAGPGAENAES